MNASGDRRCVFSPDRVYRYTLWRSWNRFDEMLPFVPPQGIPRLLPMPGSYAMFVALNPSIATDEIDDPTIRRCIGFAKRWGYDSLCMTNAFAFRATNPWVMKSHIDPVGPDNDYWLKKMAVDAEIVIAAWGVDGAHMNRATEVVDMIGPLHCLGTTKDGFPKHPLYLRADLQPIPYNRTCYKK